MKSEMPKANEPFALELEQATKRLVGLECAQGLIPPVLDGHGYERR